MALYLYGLLKTPLVSPVTQMPPRSQYYDMVADLRFQMNSMSPEEVVPFFYPQIYNISDHNLSDEAFPEVSIFLNPNVHYCFSWNNSKEKHCFQIRFTSATMP